MLPLSQRINAITERWGIGRQIICVYPWRKAQSLRRFWPSPPLAAVVCEPLSNFAYFDVTMWEGSRCTLIRRFFSCVREVFAVRVGETIAFHNWDKRCGGRRTWDVGICI